MSTSPVVYLVDDDPSVLKAFTRLLNAEGFETRPYPSPRSFLNGHDSKIPGCIVLDVAMPELSGIEIQKILATHAQPVVFISGNSDIATSVSAMKGGAVDFLTKPVTTEVFLAAIEAAITKDGAERENRALIENIEARLATLTPREKAVFQQVIAGRLNKQIAGDLGIVEKTVKVHRGRMMQKMGVRTVAELVQLADRIRIPTPRN